MQVANKSRHTGSLGSIGRKAKIYNDLAKFLRIGYRIWENPRATSISVIDTNHCLSLSVASSVASLK